jgi:hypothetical protein
MRETSKDDQTWHYPRFLFAACITLRLGVISHSCLKTRRIAERMNDVPRRETKRFLRPRKKIGF